MKKTLLLFMTMLSCVLSVSGQGPKGELYWVVETNKNVTDYSLVKIYDSDNNLLHEVAVENRLDIQKRKDRKKLVAIVKRYSNRATANGKRHKSKSSV
jgi:hypothetical protein